MGFPTKNDHFGVFWGVPSFKETSNRGLMVFTKSLGIFPFFKAIPFWGRMADDSL